MPSLSASSNQSENYEVQQDGYDLLGSEVEDSMTFEFEASRLDHTVTTGSVIEKFNKWTNHVLVIVSNRFGIKGVSEEYYKVIKKYMKLDSFIGLVGGRPRYAYYFVGHLERPAGNGLNLSSINIGKSNISDKHEKDEADRLVFLDPHYVNP